MQSISTKTGDSGMSGLANGERVPKDSIVFEVIGTVDELNSWLGLVVASLHETHPEKPSTLLAVQDTLFYVGAELARSPQAKLAEKDLAALEAEAESLQSQMEDRWMQKFLLPGGTVLAAQIDIARTVCRRTERLAFRYSKEEEVSPLILQYLNRLSDYLYLLRCLVNASAEVTEKPFMNDQKQSKRNQKHTK